MDTVTITSIAGYILLAISEIVAILPVPANGLLHSLFIGLNNSLKNSNYDIELAQTLINNKPTMANLVTALEGNPKLINAISILTQNPQILPFISKLSNDESLQYINTLLINNPGVIKNVKQIITNAISSNSLNTPDTLDTSNILHT
jgi:hypothetical protein